MCAMAAFLSVTEFLDDSTVRSSALYAPFRVAFRDAPRRAAANIDAGQRSQAHRQPLTARKHTETAMQGPL